MTKRRKNTKSPVPEDPCSEVVSILSEPSITWRRLQTFGESASHFLSYRKLWHAVARMPKKEKCQRLGRVLADRAYEAEKNARILISIGIDSLNQLADTGVLYQGIREASRDVASNRDRVQGALKKLRRVLKASVETLDTGFIVEVEKLLQHRRVVIQHHDESLEVSVLTRDGESRQFAIVSKPPNSGRLGRVNGQEFFNGSKNGSITSQAPIIGLDDCHHKDQRVRNRLSRHLDPYNSLIGNLALAKEMMYNHARRVDELGITAFQGNTGDDQCNALIVALVCVVALVIAAAVGILGRNVSVGGGATIQVGSGQPTPSGLPGGLQQPLTVSDAEVLILAATLLSGITCADNAACGFQFSNLLSIQA